MITNRLVLLLLLVPGMCLGQLEIPKPGIRPQAKLPSRSELVREHPVNGLSVRPPHLPASFTTETVSGNASAKRTKALSSVSGSPQPGLVTMQDTGNGPIATTTGDFNGDGNMDWATAMLGDNTIWVYLGNGDGTWKDPEIISLRGAGPVCLAAADLSGSGKLDLVVAEENTSTVGVLLGTGDGTFQPEVEYVLPAKPESLVIGDFNNDGKPDVVVGNLVTVGIGPVSFLAGDGTGKLGRPVNTSAQLFSGGLSLVAGDLNRDGKLDLLITGDNYGGVQVALGKGDGTFSQGQQIFAPYVFPSQGPALLGDVDHDGCLDTVIFRQTGIATFFKGNCDGTFQIANPTYTSVGAAAVSGSLTDLNGDGNLDIVGGSENVPLSTYGGNEGNLIFVAFGDGKGGFGSSATVYRTGSDLYGLAVANLHNSEKPDIIAPSMYASTLAVLSNDGTGHFAAPAGTALGGADYEELYAVVSAPVVLDLNGDGLPDIALSHESSSYGVLSALLQRADGSFALLNSNVLHADAPSVASSIAFGDFRRKGSQDAIALGSFLDSEGSAPFFNFVPSNADGTFGNGTLTSPPAANGQAGVGDFNGDGKLDMVAAGIVNGVPALTVFLGNGDGTFTAQSSVSLPTTYPSGSLYAASVFVADFNGDGKLDVLAQYYSGSSVEPGILFEAFGDGHGGFTGMNVVAMNIAPIYVADLNHDGLPDFVTGGSNSSRPGFSVYLCQPGGSFSAPKTYTPYLDMMADRSSPYPLASTTTQPVNGAPLLGDFDGDGNIDVAMAESDGFQGQARLFFATGKGDGTFTQHLLRTPTNSPNPPGFVGDIRGKGITGLLQVDVLPGALTAAAGVFTHATFAIEFRALPVSSNGGHLRLLLDAPATAPTSFSLESDNPQVGIPSQVTVAAGSTYADIDFPLGASFDFTHAFVVTAANGTESHQALGYAIYENVPAISMTPAFLDFGNVDYEVQSPPQTVTITNFGDAVFTFTQPLALTDDLDFELLSTTCGRELAAGASCSAQIGFYPNDPSESSPYMSSYLEAVGRSGTTAIPMWGYGVVIQTTLSLSPATLNFSAAFGRTTAPQTVTITNTGSELLVMYPPSIVGQPPFQLTENTCTQPVAPQGACQLTFVFAAPQPSENASYNGEALLSGDFLTLPTITLNGEISSGAIQASPPSVNFGTVTGNLSGTQTITISNTSQDAIYISSTQLSIEGVEDDTCRDSLLAANQACTISLNVSSEQPGTVLGTLTVVSTAVNARSLVVPLSAEFPPQQTAINPNYGAIAASINLTGNFGPTEGTGFVQVNGAKSQIISWSNSTITVRVPYNGVPGLGSVVVTAGGIKSNAVPFTLYAFPTITDVSVATGTPGTPVTITGTNLLDGGGEARVTFNGTPATITSDSATRILVSVPTGATSGQLRVTVNGVSLEAVASFAVLNPPNITGTHPNYGAIAASINLTGNFGPTEGIGFVQVNGAKSQIISWSNNAITIRVPYNGTLGMGSVVVTADGQRSNPVPFTLYAFPTITNISAATGTPGTLVTIAGTNLLDGGGNASVTFNGTPATIASDTATGIQVMVPADATSGQLRVTVNGIAVEAAASFVVEPSLPNISAISPNYGAIAASINLTGNFGATEGTGYVQVNGAKSQIISWSNNSITIRAPYNGTLGMGSVVVTADGQRSNPVPFTLYAFPTITNTSAATGTPGTPVTITGTNLLDGGGKASVTFNGIPATIMSNTAGVMQVTVPADATSGQLRVTVNGVAVEAAASFVVEPSLPNISAMSPNYGAIAASINLTGNFGATEGTGYVQVNGAKSQIISWSNSAITIRVPYNGTLGIGSVVVTADGQRSNAVPFTLYAFPTITNISVATGTPGTPVTITGSNLLDGGEEAGVTFNGTPATITSDTATSILVSVPTGATSGQLRVTVNGVELQPAANFVVN